MSLSPTQSPKTTPSAPFTPLSTKISVVLAVTLSLLGLSVGGAALLAHMRPGADNSALNIIVFAMILPTLAGTLAMLQVYEVHLLVNSRMSELLQQTGLSAHAEGIVYGIATEQRRERVNNEETARAAKLIVDTALIEAQNLIDLATTTKKAQETQTPKP